MIWVIEMQNGVVFEANTKREFISDIVEYYASNGSGSDDIKAIYYIFKNDKCGEICQNAITRIQEIVDDKLEEWHEISRQEQEAQEEIEFDLHCNLI